MSVKPVIYIAGPLSKGDRVHNVKQSDEAFDALARAGFAPINPIWSTFSGSIQSSAIGTYPFAYATVEGLGLTHAQWLDVDCAIVERCDAVLRLPGESLGAYMETNHALDCDIPVYNDINELIADRADLIDTDHDVSGEEYDETYEAKVGEAVVWVSEAGEGAWDFCEGDTVRCDGSVFAIEDAFRGLMRHIPETLIKASDDPVDREYQSLLAAGRYTKHDQEIHAYLARRIA